MFYLFYVFNSITQSEAKTLRKPLIQTSDHWNFLNEAEQVLGKLKVNSRTGKLPPGIIGWKENIIAFEIVI